MWRIKYYMNKLVYRIKHLNGPMDYLWLAVTVYNTYGVYTGLMMGNFAQVLISGLFLALSLQFLFR